MTHQITIVCGGAEPFLMSRSEAKHMLTDMDPVEEITLDFSGVEFVGQGFVDEVFRVWQNAHPSTVLTPIGMNSEVEFMVKRGLARAEEINGQSSITPTSNSL